MQVERRSWKNKSKKPWMPRPPALLPAPKVIRSKKAYDRKSNKRSIGCLFQKEGESL